jgi:hypothetical protein
VPVGVDRARMDRASALFVDHGMTIGTLLGLASLLECYTAKLGVQSLYATERMGRTGASKRVGETSQFVVQVMQPGGLFAGGQGLPVIAKVRLMHGAARFLIGQTDWDRERLGVPICQEDLLATLMTFGHSPLRQFPKLGVTVSERDKEDFLYYWNVVGHPLGVRPDRLPESSDEAEEIFRRICSRQQGPSKEGKELARALLDTYAELVPGTMFDGIVAALARWLAGDEVCDMLDVPASKWRGVLEAGGFVFKAWNAAQERSTGVNRLVNKLGYAALTKLSLGFTGGRTATFDLPKELREAWKMPALGELDAAMQMLSESSSRLLANEASRARAASVLADVMVLLASADGEIDELEVEGIVETLVGCTGGVLRADDARSLLGPTAKEIAKDRARVLKRTADELRAMGKSADAMDVAWAVAKLSHGVSEEERRAIVELSSAIAAA